MNTKQSKRRGPSPLLLLLLFSGPFSFSFFSFNTLISAVKAAMPGLKEINTPQKTRLRTRLSDPPPPPRSLLDTAAAAALNTGAV